MAGSGGGRDGTRSPLEPSTPWPRAHRMVISLAVPLPMRYGLTGVRPFCLQNMLFLSEFRKFVKYCCYSEKVFVTRSKFSYIIGMKKTIATIQKIRYLTYPTYHHEIWYTLEGSDKVRKYKLYNSSRFRKTYCRLDEIWHWWKTIDWALRSKGDGSKAKVCYDRGHSHADLKTEIEYCGNGLFFLRSV